MFDRVLLFQEDWKRPSSTGLYPKVHTTTKNMSFKRMHVFLKKFGIKNNKFFLALYDESLADVDPHNLPEGNQKELCERIAAEVAINPWYFFREFMRVPVPGGGIPFELHRANLAILFLWLNHITLLAIIPRQLGKTTVCLSILAYVQWVVGYNSASLMVAKDAGLINDNMDEIGKIRELWPSWFVHMDKTKDVNNRRRLRYGALNNTLRTGICVSQFSRADALGRGAKIPNCLWDEFAYSPLAEVTHLALIPATLEAGRRARVNRQPHGVMLITTAGRPLEPSGAYAYKVLQESMTFRENVYDTVDNAALNEIVARNSANDCVALVYSYKQLGRDDSWLEAAVRKQGGNEESIRRDFLNQWLFGVQGGLVSTEMAARLNASVINPEYTEVIDELYYLDWWVPREIRESQPFKARRFVIGMDSSSNTGRDFSTFVIIEPATMSVIGEIRCNESNTNRMVMMIYYLMTNILPNSILVPERNNMGAALIDSLMVMLERAGISPFTRVFNTLAEEYDTLKPADREAFTPYAPYEFDHLRKRMGFNTTGRTRELLYKRVLTTALTDNAERIHSKHIVDEICSLRIRDGRIDHSTAGHDDTAIAYLLAAFFIYYAKNKHLYGMSANDLPRQYVAAGTEQRITIEDYNQQINLRVEIRKYEEQMRRSQDPGLRVWYQDKINVLKKKLRTDISPAVITQEAHRDAIFATQPGAIAPTFGRHSQLA